MKIKDPDLWQAQLAEIAIGPDRGMGEGFMEFTDHWCSRAEKLILTDELAEEIKSYGEDPLRCQMPSPVEALRNTLPDALEELGDTLPIGWLGQILLIVYTHWHYGGPDMFEELTVFEKLFVADTMSVLLHTLNLQAEEVPSAPPG